MCVCVTTDRHQNLRIFDNFKIFLDIFKKLEPNIFGFVRRLFRRLEECSVNATVWLSKVWYHTTYHTIPYPLTISWITAHKFRFCCLFLP